MEMPHKTLTYAKTFCSNYRLVRSVNYFSTLNDTLDYFFTRCDLFLWG